MRRDAFFASAGGGAGCVGRVAAGAFAGTNLFFARSSGGTFVDFEGGKSVSDPLDIEMMDRSEGNCAGFRGIVDRAGLLERAGSTFRLIGDGEGARSDSSSSSCLRGVVIVTFCPG